jgi:hypothetical protein
LRVIKVSAPTAADVGQRTNLTQQYCPARAKIIISREEDSIHIRDPAGAVLIVG